MKTSWIHHVPSGKNKERIPAITVINVSPEIHVMLNSEAPGVVPDIFFIILIRRRPHVQQRSEI